MPPRRRTPAPPPVDIEAIRRKLAEGKIVRVGISRSAQFPEGGTGRVRGVGNPETDGEEYVQVELSLNGTRDVLPFTPADLTPATRGRPPGSGRKSAEANGGSAAAAGETSPPRTAPPSSPQQSTLTMPVEGAPQRPSPVRISGDGTEGSGAERVSPGSVPTSPATERPGGAWPARQTGPEQPKVKPVRGAKRAAPVSITVATSAAEPTRWRIEARIGTRVAVKSAVVPPARVWQLVQTLDNDDLNRAVGAILEEHRTAAQARADALASELAAVQAELEALPQPRE
jgi:hypothetical protein